MFACVFVFNDTEELLVPTLWITHWMVLGKSCDLHGSQFPFRFSAVLELLVPT